MTYRKAISRANALRPNTFTDEQKFAWLAELDAQIAGTLRVDVQPDPFPEDAELWMPFPHDNVYVLYLVAMIDYYNQETNLYANDYQMYNAALDEAKAWWNRNNRPPKNPNWSVM